MIRFFARIIAGILNIYDQVRYACIQFRQRKFWRLRDQQYERLTDIFQSAPEPPETSAYRYRRGWICRDCDEYNEIFFDKFAVSLDSERHKLQPHCASCDSLNSAVSTSLPNVMDDEIIAFWLANQDAYFWPQDEDLMLAYLPVVDILGALTHVHSDGSEKLSSYKSLELVEAMLVKFRDGEYNDDEKEALIGWISKNRQLWDVESVWEYLRTDVNKALEQHQI